MVDVVKRFAFGVRPRRVTLEPVDVIHDG